MAMDFKVEFCDDHIRVELGPDFIVDPGGQDEFWNEVRSACDRYDSRRVLVEGCVPSGERDTAEVIDAGQRTAAVPNLWLAFHLEGFVPTDKSELFQVIAGSGGVRVKFFSDSERALKWLRSNSPR